MLLLSLIPGPPLAARSRAHGHPSEQCSSAPRRRVEELSPRISQAGLTSQLPPGSRIQGLQGLNCGCGRCGRCGLCKVPAAKLAAVAGASETPRSNEGRGSIDPHPGSESSRAPRIAHQWTERSRPHRVY